MKSESEIKQNVSDSARLTNTQVSSSLNIIGSLRGESRPEILPFRENEFKTIEQYPSQVSNTISARKEDGEESFTLTKTDIHGISDGFKIRRLTPIECERLQGFPDNWTEGFSDTQRYKMMGNAVTTKLIQAITDNILTNNVFK